MKIRGGTFLATAAFTFLFSNTAPVFSQPATSGRDSQGNTPLHQAVLKSGGLNTRAVAELLTAGADVNATNFAGQTPLHLAAASVAFWSYGTGNNGVAHVLLGAGANVNAQDNQGFTPLHTVALSSTTFRKEATQSLLEAGANPNARDKYGRTPVHLFLTGKWPWTGASESLAQLAAAGADFSARDNDGKTPLHYLAALGGRGQNPLFFIQNIGGLLGAAKVDCSARDNAGDTPLHVAARNGSREIYEWLVQHGASLDTTNNAGETPRQLAGPLAPNRFIADIDIYEAARAGNLDRVKNLLKSNPALLNETNLAGDTPLRAAANANRSFVVDFLVQAGALWDDISATAANQTNELRRILANTPSAVSNTALLQVAAAHNAAAAAELLISAGADVNAADRFGRSPLGTALLGHRLEAAKVFRDHGAAENVFDANFLDDVDAAQELLATNKLLSQATNGDGVTLTEIAVATGHIRMLSLLLNNGASTDESGGTTPLHLAAAFNRTNEVELLLQRDAGVESFDSQGLTPLQTAAKNNATEAVAVLLTHKSRGHAANPDTQVSLPISFGAAPKISPAFSSAQSGTTTIGSTALHFAAMKANTNIIALLLQAGATVNVTNQDGLTPLDLASDPRMGLVPNFFESRNILAYMPPELFRGPRFSRPATYFEKQEASRLLEKAGAVHGEKSSQPGLRPLNLNRPF